MTPRARMGLVFLALLGASPVRAGEPDIFAVGRCQHRSSEERAAMTALDRSLSARSAANAADEVQRRLAAPLSAPAPQGAAPRRLAATIEGWLIKKQWLGARERREHDADEAAAYCEFLRRETQPLP